LEEWKVLNELISGPFELVRSTCRVEGIGPKVFIIDNPGHPRYTWKQDSLEIRLEGL